MEPAELTNIFEAISASQVETNERLDQVSANLAEIPKAFTDAFEAAKPDPEDKAKLEKNGPLEGLSKMKVWDVPLGEALVGGFSAVFASELIDGFMVNQSAQTLGIVKLAGAGVMVKWGGRLLGSTGSKAAALILAYDGIRQLFPLDEMAGNLAGAIKSRTGGGLAGRAGMNNAPAPPPVNRGTFYSTAFAGRY